MMWFQMGMSQLLCLVWGREVAHVDHEEFTIYLPTYSGFSKDALLSVKLQRRAAMSRNGVEIDPFCPVLTGRNVFQILDNIKFGCLVKLHDFSVPVSIAY